MKIFLKAKHRQLFALTFGIPLLFQLGFIVSMFLGIDVNRGPSSWGFVSYIKLFPLMMTLYLVVLFGWYWSASIGLRPLLPPEVTLSTRKFKVFFYAVVIYFVSIIAFVGLVFTGAPVLHGGIVVIIPLHLVAMYGTFYIIYFVAQTLKTVELQRKATFSDFAGEFFMIWFFPIGIWILQPRINAFIAGEGK